jgi:hypothetical protein
LLQAVAEVLAQPFVPLHPQVADWPQLFVTLDTLVPVVQAKSVVLSQTPAIVTGGALLLAAAASAIAMSGAEVGSAL